MKTDIMNNNTPEFEEIRLKFKVPEIDKELMKKYFIKLFTDWQNKCEKGIQLSSVYRHMIIWYIFIAIKEYELFTENELENMFPDLFCYLKQYETFGGFSDME